jgi:MerR family transcriptional regulator, light-induced transcriptional regulator
MSASTSYSIAAVERDTGLGKDTLRVWERRYGFPLPTRDEHGERRYSAEDVERLRLVKRLLDAGARPGKVVPLSHDALRDLAGQAVAIEDGVGMPRAGRPGARSRADARAAVALERDMPEGAAPADATVALALLKSHDARGLRQWLQSRIARVGLAAAVTSQVAPLTRLVGQAWMTGDLQVHEEHLYTEVVSGVLSAALAQLSDGSGAEAAPRVLLTTFVGEPHALGLLMAQCMLVLEGCPCTSLGPQTPLADIVRAVAASRADVVALSFSPLLPAATLQEGLRSLRTALPMSVDIWAGGSSPALDRRPVDGVRRVATLPDVAQAVTQWRSQRLAGDPDPSALAGAAPLPGQVA